MSINPVTALASPPAASSAPAPAPSSAPPPADLPPHAIRAAARAHVRRLRRAHRTYHGIAAAGVDPATIYDLVSGRRQTSTGATTAILAVTSDAVPPARLDAGGTRLRLRALHVMGHSSARIARAVGARETTIRALVRGDDKTINARLRDAIADLYDAWWDKRPPGRTDAERGAATVARKRAVAGNWCAGAALDDDQLDIPGYRPQQGWMPATGTGTAPPHPPALPPPPQEPRMTFDDRFTWGSVLEVIDVLERHGYHRYDNQHTGQAAAEPAQSNPSAVGSCTLTSAEVSTLLAALDTAADYQRDRATVCAKCTDQSCSTCYSRLRHARAYDQIVTQMSQTRDTWTASLDHPEPADRPPPPRQPTPQPTRRPGSDRPRHGAGRTRTPRPFVPQPRPSEEDLLELREPYDLPIPEYPDRWLPGPPSSVVVVDQLRGWWPDQPRSLTEILGSGPARTRDPEPDLEAEP